MGQSPAIERICGLPECAAHEVPGVFALRVEDSARPRRPYADLDRVLRAVGVPIRKDDAERLQSLGLAAWEAVRLERKGWGLVALPESTAPEAAAKKAALAAGGSRDVAVLPVYRTTEGRVLLEQGRFVVEFDESATPEERDKILAAAGLEILRPLCGPRPLYLTASKKPVHPREVLEMLRSARPVTAAEFEPIETSGPRWRPDDPEYKRQWQWPEVYAERAWDRTLGAGSRIGMIDEGFITAQPEITDALSPRSGWWELGAGRAPDEFHPGLGGMPSDEFDAHGTPCACLAAARACNKDRLGAGIGGCGMAPMADLLVQTIDEDMGQSTFARAMCHAVNPTREIRTARPEDGANVLSISWGFEDPRTGVAHASLAVRRTVEYLTTRARRGLGVPIFWAVANLDCDVSRDELVTLPGVTAVGFLSRSGSPALNSAKGKGLDLVAPGEGVLSSFLPGGPMLDRVGTSFAAPIVAGVASLMLSAAPGLSREQLERALLATCEKVGGLGLYDLHGHSRDYGHGRVDAAAAVELAIRSAGGIAPQPPWPR